MPRFAARAAALFLLLLTAAASGLAATTTDFYLSLLRRGIASHDAGRYDAAARELDLAAFGLIESIDHFETAKIYSAVANDKLGRQTQTLAAVRRVLAAERVQKRFAQLSLPAEVRTAFVAAAKKVLTAPEMAELTTPPATPPATPPRAATATPKKNVETRTVPFPSQPAPTPQPQTSHAVTTPPPPPAPKPIPSDVAARLAAADKHLAAKDLVNARMIYRQLLDGELDRASTLAVAERSYRARDFATAVRAFDRVGTLNRGEEPQRFYLAVSLFETGNYSRAKRELAASLPYIEITDSVATYKAKIEGAGK